MPDFAQMRVDSDLGPCFGLRITTHLRYLHGPHERQPLESVSPE